MTLPLKRRRRVEILIDQRMLSFLKPTAVATSSSARRRRDSLEFLTPFNERNRPHDQATDKAS